MSDHSQKRVETVVSIGTYQFSSSYVIHTREHAFKSGSWHALLEIKDPPDGQSSFYIGAFHPSIGAGFLECDSYQSAKYIYDANTEQSEYRQIEGANRLILCVKEKPWFYL